MPAVRSHHFNTSDNLAAILDIIRDIKTTKVTLFASPEVPTQDMSDSDGPETNLPLLAAMAEYKLPGVSEPLYVVFDGLFLTAARIPRYLEVRDLLDVAIASGKVFFDKVRAPFTSSLTPDAAAECLGNLGPVSALTGETRASYFRLLSNVSESDLAKS